jgi:hypothetical protein
MVIYSAMKRLRRRSVVTLLFFFGLGASISAIIQQSGGVPILTGEGRDIDGPGISLAASNETLIPTNNRPLKKGEVPPRHENEPSFSACLLTMDDTHRIVEWVTYHYHVIKLRYLVVAVDPRSRTSITPYLDLLRKELGMTIVEWTDNDYSDWEPLAANATEEELRSRFLMRQRLFYGKCMTALADVNRTWTSLHDTDEYITYNEYQINDVLQRMYKPGNVMDFMLSAPGIRQCVSYPRVLFGAVEDLPEKLSHSVPSGLSLDYMQLDTLRYRYRNPFIAKSNGLGKVAIDVSTIPKSDFPLAVRNPHRPFFFCHSPFSNDHINHSLRINHYLGSWEIYSFREDARKGGERSREGWEFRAQVTALYDNHTHGWFKGFVDDQGLERAYRLLQHSGLPKSYVKNDTDAWEYRAPVRGFNMGKEWETFLLKKRMMLNFTNNTLSLNVTNGITLR